MTLQTTTGEVDAFRLVYPVFLKAFVAGLRDPEGYKHRRLCTVTSCAIKAFCTG